MFLTTQARTVTRAARRAATLVAAIGMILAVAASPAAAHDTLTGSTPKADATVAPPSEIVLTYSANVRLPQVIVANSSDEQQPTGEPQVSGNEVTVALNGALTDGEYKVAWRVVSSDGHPIQDAYTFTVEGAPAASPGESPAESPAASPGADGDAPAAEAAPSEAASAQDEGGSSGWLWIGLIAVVIAAVAGGVAWFRRSPTSED